MKDQRRHPAQHPVRDAALALLTHEGDMSVIEMTRRMADFLEPAPTLGVVAYHVRVLADRGLIECVRLEKARGSLAHYYALADA